MTKEPFRSSTARLTGQLCVIELVAWGVLYYAFSVYIVSIEDELGWSSAAVAAGFSVALLVSGVASPWVGDWIDRHGSRGLMTTATVIGVGGITLWSFAYTFPVYLGAWVLIGLAMAGVLYAPAFATVVRFNPDKSRNGILIITLVGALASPIFLMLSSLLGEWLGWRGGLRVLAILLAIVIVPLTVLLPSTRATATLSRSSDTSTKKTPRSYWGLTSALMLVDLASVAVTVHLVVFLIQQGQPDHTAASIAGLVGLAKIGGRLTTLIVSRVSAVMLLQASVFTTAIALTLPQLWPTTWAAMLMVLVFGAAGGARTVLRPAVLVELYGSKRFGMKSGYQHLFSTIAKACGPVGFGVLLGFVGWTYAWSALAMIAAAGGAVLLLIRPPAKTLVPVVAVG
ncbi:MAG: MFS transporter [Planctomycetota bacterium]